MAGTLVLDTLKSATANQPPAVQDSAGVAVGQFCRAWVNFNGTGTIAIRDSFNVASITDGGTGKYTINLTNAMPNANYALAALARPSNSAGYIISGYSTVANTTTAVLLTVQSAINSDNSLTWVDLPDVSAIIFGD